MGTADNSRYMAEALALAQRAAGRTSPNPLVGAVIVAGGQVVGRGYHPRAGEPHAEIFALREAGARARGGTLYVTLEPCNHAGLTGPCTEALLAAGVRRIVAAMVDPDPQVNGKGLARLREAGVAVEVGVLEDEARRVNEFFVKHRRTGLPFVALKWAMSLDGKIAAHRGAATPMTGEDARRFVHALRNVYDAVLVGVQTILADDPQLTCRLPVGSVPAPRNPLRVIVDSRLRTPLTARIVTGASDASTLVVTTAAAPLERVDAMRRAGVEVQVQDPAEHGAARVDLRVLAQELGRRGVLSLLIEGGGTVNAAALDAGIVDKVIALIAPRLIGGSQSPTPVDGGGLAGASRPSNLRDVQVRPLGDDIAIEGYVTG